MMEGFIAPAVYSIDPESTSEVDDILGVEDVVLLEFWVTRCHTNRLLNDNNKFILFLSVERFMEFSTHNAG
jgi:hypothetical protein